MFALRTLVIFALGLRYFQHHKRVMANRALGLDRHIPAGIVTLGIFRTSVEQPATLGLLFDYISGAIFARTLDPERNRLGVLTVRVSRTGHKPAEPARLDNHR